ncbi:hypothetical protein A33Q_0515 [Indibacter alkaliphilus LW1]|uniref:Uncharacterized protein n=1 Tax=Indibacter alkaliphilus (strain CCUG 57479 / KCTC 22604 / LW1) TaxID=1189612 RepID=S2DL48_INDAL|nr:hypothetical protein A33Q_0515 [Indibacter alkaliphilus LW1]
MIIISLEDQVVEKQLEQLKNGLFWPKKSKNRIVRTSNQRFFT